MYSKTEERLNVASHALGLLLSVVALVLLVMRATQKGDAWHVVSFAIFGIGLVTLYAASTAYHSSRNPASRAKLRVLDHAAIYILIAATYTPLCLLVLRGWQGWTIFGFSWAMAVTGVVIKLFFTGRFERTSTAMYIFMGWIIVFAIKPLMENLCSEGLFWLVAGGVSYTVGAGLFSLRKLPLNHALFHLFVLGGSLCHFIAVYVYVI
ncbi:MAG: hemolysin III family protein [Verrucomicrobiales bacterium]|nr:hemolysin III family protein [Verrucomicrobiales bacterium]